MTGIYGHKFTSAFGSNPRGTAGKLWATALAGLSRADLDRGIAACQAAPGEEWPTLQLFRDRCYGIPTLAQVAHQLRKPADAEPFALKVRSYLDLHLFQLGDSKARERMVRDAYELAHAAVMRGEALPKKLPKLTAEEVEVVPASAETVDRTFAEIRELLGLSHTEAEHMGIDGMRRAAGLDDVDGGTP